MTPEQIANLPYRQNVGVMLVNAEGAAFVGQRLDSEVAAWQMPQGGIDKGEDAEAAALRELEEETGVSAQTEGWISYDLPHDIVPKIWKGRFKGQEQKWFLFRFHGQDDQINIEVDHQEFSEWRWLPVDQLVANIVPFKRAVYEQVVAEFAPHL
jgi:putative (di)nucleoside polyphosphate hydrolase